MSVPGDFPTIQAALDGAPEDSVIQLAAGRYAEALKLTGIRRTLTVRGDPANPAAVVIDGGGTAQPVLHITATANVAFEGLTVTGGRGTTGVAGGLLMAYSDVVFRDCVFEANTSDADAGAAYLNATGAFFQRCVFRGNHANTTAGAVLVYQGASVAFEQCQFVDNESGLTNATFGYGGAVVVTDADAMFVKTTFQNNRASSSSGALAVLGHYGKPRTVATIRDTVFAGNQVTLNPDADGGAIHTEDNAVTRLERCQVRGNTAHRGGGLSSYRGGYEIVDSVIEDNAADAFAGQPSSGGGISIQSVNVSDVQPPATLALVRSVVRRNSADTGGGIFAQGDFMQAMTRSNATLESVLVLDNTAAIQGAGLLLDRTDGAITGSLIARNVVGNQGSFGGGVLSAAGSATAIVNTTIADNEAPSQGGGIYVDQGGALHVEDSRITYNRALDQYGGGGIAIGQAGGPVAPPVTGSVTGSVIAYNGPNVQIYEADCPATTRSAITYTGNTISSGSAITYRGLCYAPSPTVASFNALAGKASGNVDAAPSFAHFLAAPATIMPGSAGVLGWCVIGVASATLSPGGSPVVVPDGATDVSPAASTTYSLQSGAQTLATLGVTVACDAVGMPVAHSPARGQHQPPEGTTLRWYPATGATSYDVYLDTSPSPTTLFAADVTGTTIDVPSLNHGAQYHWQVVAKGAGCGTPVAGPIAAFETCAGAVCDFSDNFDDGDAGDWQHLGRGTARVRDGALYVTARGRLRLMPPVEAMSDATIAATVAVQRGRREVRVLFGWQDEAHYDRLVIKGARGLWLIQRRDGRRLTTVARAHGRKLGTNAQRVELLVVGTTATATVDGAPVLSGSLVQPPLGRIALEVLTGTTVIDDVDIAPGVP